jgi:hypothetical protein
LQGWKPNPMESRLSMEEQLTDLDLLCLGAIFTCGLIALLMHVKELLDTCPH